MSRGFESVTKFSSNVRHHSSRYVDETGWPFDISSMILRMSGIPFGSDVKPSCVWRDHSHSSGTSGQRLCRSSSCRFAIALRGLGMWGARTMLLYLRKRGRDVSSVDLDRFPADCRSWARRSSSLPVVDCRCDGGRVYSCAPEAGRGGGGRIGPAFLTRAARTEIETR